MASKNGILMPFMNLVEGVLNMSMKCVSHFLQVNNLQFQNGVTFPTDVANNPIYFRL